MRDEKKILTEFYIKNIIRALLEPNLNDIVKDEAPDFSDEDHLLEIVSLVEEDVAEPHSFFEKYKGCIIEEIPDGVFKRTHCHRSNLEPLSFGGYGIRNCAGELRFIFNKEKVFIAYIHQDLSVPKMVRLLNKEIIKKRERLNKVYKKKNSNYLGINVPNSFFNFKEEQAITNFKNSDFYKSVIANNDLLFFDRLFIVFYDFAFDIDLRNDKTSCIEIPETIRIKAIEESKTEAKIYLESHIQRL